MDVDPPLGDSGLSLNDVLGYYSASLLSGGDLVLRKNIAEVWGVYQFNQGTVIGEITSDGVFVGWWSEAPAREGNNAGEVEYRWTQSRSGAISIDGRWRYGTSGLWFENWDASFVTDRSPPSDLVARFENVTDFRRHP